MCSVARLALVAVLALAAGAAFAQTPPCPEKIATVCAQSEARSIARFGPPPHKCR